MNIVEKIVDMNAFVDEGPFISDPLRVGNDGKAMFTACPKGGDVSYGIMMQVNIAATGPDGPFEDQWAYVPYVIADHEEVHWPTSGVYSDLIPGAFVRVVIYSADLASPQDSVSLRLTLRTEALSGSQ